MDAKYVMLSALEGDKHVLVQGLHSYYCYYTVVVFYLHLFISIHLVKKSTIMHFQRTVEQNHK